MLQKCGEFPAGLLLILGVFGGDRLFDLPRILNPTLGM